MLTHYLVFEPVEETVDQISDSARLADFEAYTQRELPKLFWAALEEVVAKEMEPVEERLRAQLMTMIRDCQERVLSTYQYMVSSTIDTLQLDHSTKEKLLAQFEPLSRTTSANSQLRSAFSLSGLSDMSVPSTTNQPTNVSHLPGFNSSTTLSSIFDSSTTLSSVFGSTTTLSSAASSQVPPAIKATDATFPGKVDEMTGCVFGANDDSTPSMAVTNMLPNDFWTTDLDETDLSQLDAMGIWNLTASLDENSQRMI